VKLSPFSRLINPRWPPWGLMAAGNNSFCPIVLNTAHRVFVLCGLTKLEVLVLFLEDSPLSVSSTEHRACKWHSKYDLQQRFGIISGTVSKCIMASISFLPYSEEFQNGKNKSDQNIHLKLYRTIFNWYT
jgi:hypothetical protein